jgi:hypothetical protein
MAAEGRGKAKDLARAFQRMKKPASEGGTGGTFTAAATKAGHEDSPEGRKAYANEVLSNPENYSDKMVKKANFYKNVISQ